MEFGDVGIGGQGAHDRKHDKRLKQDGRTTNADTYQERSELQFLHTKSIVYTEQPYKGKRACQKQETVPSKRVQAYELKESI
jgi:hypothetical protein